MHWAWTTNRKYAMTIQSTRTSPEESRNSRFVLPHVPDSLRTQLEAGGAVAWSEPVAIVTYEPHSPSPYPMYFDQRVYQGSSGRVYPMPFTERIDATASLRKWEAIHLENRYLRVMILPELGGRIHVAYDKTTDYDFFYRNNVIKPALVGLTGPWMSGGVEFNWPQHHRPATFLPVQSTIQEHDDGSVTVWCSDHDPFTRMRGTHGIHIDPDRSTIRLDVRLHNRTSLTQSFLWWANVAVRVNDDYQSFFPEDVRYVADHARRALTTFPRADRPYYGVDYTALARERPGADRLDFYRNIPVPTSYMTVDTDHEFFGGFDHARSAGFVHWADSRVAPGKKQWTWGNAPFGHAWDRLLTDDDGPYIELMAGVFTDNQPDFSWLLPGESKQFSQFWYPIPAIGVAHEATPNAAIHVDRDDIVRAAVAVTRPQLAARMSLKTSTGGVLAERSSDVAPGDVWRVDFEVPYEQGMRIEVCDARGRVLVEWTEPEPAPADAEPWTATAPPEPKDVASADELYVIGVHLLQFRHPSRSPLPYWHEALRRDPEDSRVLTALAEVAYRAGDYDTALERVSNALSRVTSRNSNPRHADSLYLLGLIELRRGNAHAARKAFAKASWDGSLAGAAGLEMVRDAARRGDVEGALSDLDALDAVAADDRRRGVLRVSLLRRLGHHSDALAVLDRLRSEEPLNPTIRFLAEESLPEDGRLLVDVALELAQSGERHDALRVLTGARQIVPGASGNVLPIAHYHRAAILDGLGEQRKAALEREQARIADRRWCFPSGLDDHDALVAAIRADDDPVARLLLGMLLYDAGRRTAALEQWEKAIEAGLEDALLYRNAGLASYNVARDDVLAERYYGLACAMRPADARLLFERDQLAHRLGEPDSQRLARLQSHFAIVVERDDLVIEFAQLLVSTGAPQEALDLIEGRSFQPWEGGEGRVLGAWDRARKALGLGVGEPPESLGESRPSYRPPVARRLDGEVDYFTTSLPEDLLFTRA
jgi:tetratricopeptide (TPR) repeat protein